MFEFSLVNNITGEYKILFGHSLDGAMREAGLNGFDWTCYHIYDSYEERRVW